MKKYEKNHKHQRTMDISCTDAKDTIPLTFIAARIRASNACNS